jgi:2-methylcitrate dehydratase
MLLWRIRVRSSACLIDELAVDHLLRMKINIDWDKQGYDGVVESTIKKYNSMIHTQSAVHCMV